MSINSSSQPLWWRQLKAIPGAINRSQHKWLNWGALGYIIFGVLLALNLPDDGFNRFLLVDAFCSKIEMMVPSIEKYEQVSNFRNVTRTVLSVLWALSPIMLFLIIINLRPRKIPGWIYNNYWRQFPKALFLSVFSIILFGGFIYLFVVMPVDIEAKVNSEFINRGIAVLKAKSHNKFWLGMMGSLECLSVALFLWFCIAYIYVLVLLVFGFFRNFYFLFIKKDN